MSVGLYPIVRRARRALIDPNQSAVPQFENGIPDVDKRIRDEFEERSKSNKPHGDQVLTQTAGGTNLNYPPAESIAPVNPEQPPADGGQPGPEPVIQPGQSEGSPTDLPATPPNPNGPLGSERMAGGFKPALAAQRPVPAQKPAPPVVAAKPAQPKPSAQRRASQPAKPAPKAIAKPQPPVAIKAPAPKPVAKRLRSNSETKTPKPAA